MAGVCLEPGHYALTSASEFIPNQDESQFNIQVETPVGTSIRATDEVLQTRSSGGERQAAGRAGDVFTTIGAGSGRVGLTWPPCLPSWCRRTERDAFARTGNHGPREAIAWLICLI